MACWAWNVPSLPVKPCTKRRVFSLTRMLIGFSLCRGCHYYLGRIAHPISNAYLEAGLVQDLASLLGVGTFHAEHDRNLLGHRGGCLHYPLRDDISAQDSAENID